MLSHVFTRNVKNLSRCCSAAVNIKQHRLKMPSGKGRIFVVRVSAWLYFKSSTSQQYRKHVVVTFSMFKKKKKSSGQEPERKMNSSLLGDVRAVQPSTSSPLYCQAGVATATLTLCKPHGKQDESGENHCVLLHYFSLAVCLYVCVSVHVCVCVCMCMLLISCLSEYSGFVVYACVL